MIEKNYGILNLNYLNTGNKITDPTGLEAFINITTLFMINHNLSSINLSTNTNLNGIYIQDNLLDTIIFPAANNIEYINLNGNKLNDFNSSMLPDLIEVDLGSNHNTSLQTGIDSLDFSFNRFVSHTYQTAKT